MASTVQPRSPQPYDRRGPARILEGGGRSGALLSRARAVLFRNLGFKILALIAAVALWSWMHSPSAPRHEAAPSAAGANCASCPPVDDR